MKLGRRLCDLTTAQSCVIEVQHLGRCHRSQRAIYLLLVDDCKHAVHRRTDDQDLVSVAHECQSLQLW